MEGYLFYISRGNSINHAIIAGTGSSVVTSGAQRAGVFVRNGSLSLANTLFKDGGGYAYATWGGARLIDVGENIEIENMASGLTNMQD